MMIVHLVANCPQHGHVRSQQLSKVGMHRTLLVEHGYQPRGAQLRSSGPIEQQHKVLDS